MHPTGGRFAVKPHQKSRRSRRAKLSPELVEALCAHADRHALGPDDPLSGLDLFAPPPKQGLADSAVLGDTEPNATGRGSCRCVHCCWAFLRGSATVSGREHGGVADEPARSADELRRLGRRLTFPPLLEHPGDLGDVDDVELERAGAAASTASGQYLRTSPSSRFGAAGGRAGRPGWVKGAESTAASAGAPSY